MRRLLTECHWRHGLLLLALAACADQAPTALPSTWALVSIDGAPMPYRQPGLVLTEVVYHGDTLRLSGSGQFHRTVVWTARDRLAPEPVGHERSFTGRFAIKGRTMRLRFECGGSSDQCLEDWQGIIDNDRVLFNRTLYQAVLPN